MSVFQRHRANDVLFLMPVRLANEKLPKGKVRMLYCDAVGKVCTSTMNRSVYELAREDAESMARRRKSFATLGLETSPGTFLPTAVEVSPKEVWALEHILEHALKKGRLPDILKQYVRPIIKLGEASRETVIAEHKGRQRRVPSEAAPRVLDRLPYYPEDDIEFSLPIYKAEHSYPLVVLKIMPPDRKTPKSPPGLLILDSAGDLAAIKVPQKFIDNMEKGLAGQLRKNRRNVCAIISQHNKGMTLNYMPISQSQRKALDTLTRYFEETGSGKQPISTLARSVLIRASSRLASSA